jgi:hypothetical protein
MTHLTVPSAEWQHLARQVTLDVPAGEATIAGHLVQQEYTIRARLRLASGPDVEGATGLRVGSASADRRWVLGTAAVVDDAGLAVVGVEDLSGRRLCGGVPVSGTVTVTPRRAGTARGVRVEIVFEERVPARADVPLEEDHVKTTVVAAVPIADRTDLEPGRALRFRFTLPVPQQLPGPSLSSSEFTLRWLLRAVLDRPLHGDTTTTIELWGTTAA